MPLFSLRQQPPVLRQPIPGLWQIIHSLWQPIPGLWQPQYVVYGSLILGLWQRIPGLWQPQYVVYGSLKGHGNEADFLGFLQKLVPHESLTLSFGPFRFWLRIRGDILIWKTTPRYHRYGESRTPRIVESGSQRLPASLICRVSNSPHHRYGESAIEFFKRKLSVLMIRRVVDSPHQWYGESLTPRIAESESRQLRVSPIWRVYDSAYRWVGGRWLRGSMIPGVAIQRKN